MDVAERVFVKYEDFTRERGYGLECYNKMIAEQNEEFERNQLDLSAFIDLPPVERVPTDNLRII